MLAKIDNPTIIPVSIEKNYRLNLSYFFFFRSRITQRQNIHPSNMKNLFVYLRKNDSSTKNNPDAEDQLYHPQFAIVIVILRL